MSDWHQIDRFDGNRTDPRLTVERPCPVCGCWQSTAVLRLEGLQFFTDDARAPKRAHIQTDQCERCAALFMNPAYTSFGFEMLFAEAGCSYGATESRPGEQIDWLAQRGLLDAGRSLLDVGCYDGRFLAKMPATVKRIGVDIDAPAITRGQQMYGATGVQLIHGDFNRFELDAPPDTITMYHVLEHLPDPVATLRHLKQQAGTQTQLVVEVPILENGFTNDLVGFFSIQHMTHFSRRSLANTVAQAGWRIVESLEQPDYNGCRIRCRPAEAEKTPQPDDGDRDIVPRLLTQIEQVKGAVQQRLSVLEDARRIVVWGGGMHTEYLYQFTDLFASPGREFVIVDNDPLKQGRSWRGIAIHGSELLTQIDWNTSWLVLSSYGSAPAMERAAIQAGVPADRIVLLYDRFRVY